MLLILAVILAAPPAPAVEGLDKPKKTQIGKLRKSELTPNGTVTVKCFDAGAVMVVEINDPGLMGASDAWLKKKTGPTMPVCDGVDTDVIRLDAMIGYGYSIGTKGDFLFVQSADSFGDREGVRVFSLTSGALVLEAERSLQKPATVKAEGAVMRFRFHEMVGATCDPIGDETEKCWQLIRDAAKIPSELQVKAPSCAKHQKAIEAAPGSSQIAVPVEVDLAAPKTKHFVAGEATCGVAP